MVDCEAERWLLARSPIVHVGSHERELQNENVELAFSFDRDGVRRAKSNEVVQIINRLVDVIVESDLSS